MLTCPPGDKQSTWQLKNGPSWWQVHLCFAPVTKGSHFICPSVASSTGCAPPGATADDLNGRPAAYKKFLMKSYSLRKEYSSSELSASHEFALLWSNSCYSKARLLIVILSLSVRYWTSTGGDIPPSLEDTKMISSKFQNQPVAKARNKFKTVPFLITA